MKEITPGPYSTNDFAALYYALYTLPNNFAFHQQQYILQRKSKLKSEKSKDFALYFIIVVVTQFKI
jgi:hypothetical protein